MRVLLVEDDTDLADLLTYALRREGYAVSTARDGHEALQRWHAERPDLVLLDCNLPKLDGFEVCRRIRQTAKTPVIMLTVRDTDEDVVRGLQVGADDYVTKPFSARTLVTRMQAVLRRCQADPAREAPREVRAGDLVLDPESHRVTKAGKPVQLTPREFRILHLLALNAGQVIPYARLIEYAWGYTGEETSGLLKAHITHIRQKLNLSPRGARDRGAIKAVVGVGYSLTRSSGAQRRSGPA